MMDRAISDQIFDDLVVARQRGGPLRTRLLADANKALRDEIAAHPKGSTCECPVFAALAPLYAAGFRLVMVE